MKIKTLSRSEQAYTRECRGDVVKIHRNLDPAVHPFERAREYTRTLNAVKLDKMFAKPFIGALDGHADGVWSMSTCKRSLVGLISGACDGEIRVWDLAHTKTVWSSFAHKGFVRGLTVGPGEESFFSCGDDKVIKQWRLEVQTDPEEAPEPLNTWICDYALMGIDHHWKDSLFATCGREVLVWDPQRAEPVHRFVWGAESIVSVKFNPAEPCLLATTGTDRTICLYDVRMSQAIRKVVLQMRTNQIAWNPMEPFNFTAANEDHNLYTFDMRQLDIARMIHKDHVSAVLDVSYSPTGKDFVSGSYDRTIRVFPSDGGRSREVYHAKRMQRVFCARFTTDARFVLSGSDDTNIRIWKAKAAESLSVQIPREREKKNYYDKLKKKFQHMPEIRRIAKHRHLPKAIRKATEAKRDDANKQRRKDANRRKHSKPGSIPYKAERKTPVVQELE